MMAALQAQLGDMIGSSSGYIEALPRAVQRRVRALKQLQAARVKIEVEFHNEVAALEKKYDEMYAPLYAKVREGGLRPQSRSRAGGHRVAGHRVAGHTHAWSRAHGRSSLSMCWPRPIFRE